MTESGQALAEATTDYERIEIRDWAKKLYAMGEILNRKDIQVLAANLIMAVEREIAKANPPETASESGMRGGRGNIKGVTRGHTLSNDVLRKMRQAHDNLSDTEFEKLQQDAIDTGEALSREKLKKISRGKKQQVRDAELKTKEVSLFHRD